MNVCGFESIWGELGSVCLHACMSTRTPRWGAVRWLWASPCSAIATPFGVSHPGWLLQYGTSQSLSSKACRGSSLWPILLVERKTNGFTSLKGHSGILWKCISKWIRSFFTADSPIDSNWGPTLLNSCLFTLCSSDSQHSVKKTKPFKQHAHLPACGMRQSYFLIVFFLFYFLLLEQFRSTQHRHIFNQRPTSVYFNRTETSDFR